MPDARRRAPHCLGVRRLSQPMLHGSVHAEPWTPADVGLDSAEMLHLFPHSARRRGHTARRRGQPFLTVSLHRKEQAMTSALSSDGGRTPAPDPGRTLCVRFVELLPVDGASISVVTELGTHSVVGASDAHAARLEARQFELGLGPHWEALRTDRPALLYRSADLLQPALWSQLVGASTQEETGALFAFPLRLGAATVGVADLYSHRTIEPWPAELIERAMEIASGVSASAVRLATRSADAATSTTGRNAVELRREVHQATGMVMAQLDCTASTALLRLRAHAFANDIPLDQLAGDVVAQRVDFADL